MKKRLQLIYNATVKRDKLLTRVILTVTGVIIMGFSMSVLEIIDFGTDPYTCMNIGWSKLTGISLGGCGLLVSAILFVFVIWQNAAKIGLGTLINMVGFGYAIELFRKIPYSETFLATIKSGFYRIAALVIMLGVFIFAVSLYLAADLGSAPYDAAPEIISAKTGVRFVFIRMIWDATAVAIGFFIGSRVGVTTLVCALGVGPCAALVRAKVDRILQKQSK